MFLKYAFRCCALAILAVAAGCSSRLLVAEVLQQPLDSRIYTRYNIWYENPAQIDCLNMQSGRILKAGTAVEPLYADESRLSFRDPATATDYTILFSPGRRMCTMREFIRQTLTLDTPEKQFDGISPELQERILRGEVVKGMSRREVIMAYGPPPPIRTPDRKMMTWTYYIDKDKSLRLVFRGDAVNEIFTVGD